MCLLCVSVISASAWADVTADVDLSKGSYDTDHITWTLDDVITIQQTKGSSSTAVNSSYISAPRVYKGHILSFEAASGYVIKSISITCSTTYYGNSMTAGIALSGNTVTDNSIAVSRTWTSTSGGTHVVSSASSDGLSAIYIQNVATANNVQLRFTELSITYAPASSAVETTTTIITSGITNNDVYVGTAAGSLSANVTETESGDAVGGATVTWSGDNDAVATINASTGAVTLVGEGTVTFTANYAGVTGEYKASSDTYEMTVVDNTPDPYMYVEVELSDLTASDVFVIVGNHSEGSYAMTNNNGTGSAPTATSVTISSGKISSSVKKNMKWNISGNATDGYTFYPNGSTTTWLYCTTTAASGSNNNMRVGTGARKVFELSSNNLITKDTNTDRYVSVYPDGPDWRGYTNNTTQPTTFKFYKAVDATYTRTVTSGNWGTICLPYDATVTGATLYTISHKELDGSSNPTALILSEETEIVGGFPYIFKATGSELVATYTSGAYEDAQDLSGLHGTYDAIAKGDFTSSLVPNDDLYLMTATTVQAANYATASVGANRAYILMEEVPTSGSPVKGVRLGFDGTETPTGINGLTPALSKGEGVIYNLQGQQLSAPQRGINIIGGKKVLVK